LIADPEAFDRAVMSLWHVASWMKDDGTDMLVPPPSNDVQRYRAAVRGALSLMFNQPIQIGDEKLVTLAMLNKGKTDERPNPAE